MPLNDEKTFEKFGYHLIDLKPFSNKYIYFNCDTCNILLTRLMSNHTNTLNNKSIKGIFCKDCRTFEHNKNSIKYNYNENYFAKKSLQACYWAGFIAADGCINDKNHGQKRLQINLSSKDKLHLFNFKNDINYTGPIYHKISKTGFIANNKKITVPKKYSILHITSNQLCNDLANIFNVGPRKSLTHEPPIGLTFEQELAFIIGYIDGDGCIYKANTDIKHPLKIGIVGTNQFLEFILNRLQLLLTKNCKAKIKKDNNSKIHKLELTNKFAFDVLNYLNNIPVNKLNRKWNKIQALAGTP